MNVCLEADFHSSPNSASYLIAGERKSYRREVAHLHGRARSNRVGTQLALARSLLSSRGMQTDDIVLTLSTFAGGSDAAVGLIAPMARYACLYWVAEQRTERVQIEAIAWPRVELEVGLGDAPRRLASTSAVVTALFGDRRASMSSELVSRFPMTRPDDVTLEDGLDALLAQVSVVIHSTETSHDSLPSALDILLSQTL